MNKIFLFLLSFFIFSGIVQAQDTLATAEPPKMTAVKYTEKDIQIDSDSIESRTFSKNYQKKYTDPDFVYENGNNCTKDAERTV